MIIELNIDHRFTFHQQDLSSIPTEEDRGIAAWCH
jgi:hypothetical protein